LRLNFFSTAQKLGLAITNELNAKAQGKVEVLCVLRSQRFNTCGICIDRLYPKDQSHCSLFLALCSIFLLPQRRKEKVDALCVLRSQRFNTCGICNDHLNQKDQIHALGSMLYFL
jgi:hypothetical protein